MSGRVKIRLTKENHEFFKTFLKIKTEPKAVFAEYEQGNTYKSSVGDLGIFEQTKRNERFF